MHGEVGETGLPAERAAGYRGYDAENCFPSIAQVRNAWSYTATAAYALLTWQVIKQRDKLIYLMYGSHGNEYENNVFSNVTPCV